MNPHRNKSNNKFKLLNFIFIIVFSKYLTFGHINYPRVSVKRYNKRRKPEFQFLNIMTEM